MADTQAVPFLNLSSFDSYFLVSGMHHRSLSYMLTSVDASAVWS